MSSITPEEYLRIAGEWHEIIEMAQQRIIEARERADKCLPPVSRRPALPSDIVEGAVIWHAREERYGGDYWHIVEEVESPSAGWKAYTADDGCRYGLHKAYVELTTEETK